MQTLTYRVAALTQDERSSGLMLDPSQVIALALAATTFYRGYARLQTHWDDLEADPELVDPDGPLDADTLLSDSEWALIRPLFLLYLERENAVMLEASRGLGVDVFGRAVSEIATDITLKEQEMPHLAFMFPAQTVV